VGPPLGDEEKFEKVLAGSLGTLSGGCGSAVCTSNERTACGDPFSKTWKSSAVRPGTGLPFASVTVTSTTTRRTDTLIVGVAGTDCVAASGAACWATRGNRPTPATRTRPKRQSGKLRRNTASFHWKEELLNTTVPARLWIAESLPLSWIICMEISHHDSHDRRGRKSIVPLVRRSRLSKGLGLLT